MPVRGLYWNKQHLVEHRNLSNTRLWGSANQQTTFTLQVIMMDYDGLEITQGHIWTEDTSVTEWKLGKYIRTSKAVRKVSDYERKYRYLFQWTNRCVTHHLHSYITVLFCFQAQENMLKWDNSFCYGPFTSQLIKATRLRVVQVKPLDIFKDACGQLQPFLCWQDPFFVRRPEDISRRFMWQQNLVFS